MFGEYLQQIRARIADVLSPQIRRLRIQTDPYVARGRASYEKLGSRERILVQIAAALLGIFLAYNLIYAPITDFVDSFDERIATREHELAGVQRLAAAYSERKADLDAAQHSTVPDTKDFSLFSVVEASFSKSIGHDKIASITSAEDKKLADGLVQHSVQLKLNGVSLAQLVDALYAVRTLSVPVGVANLRIERRTQDTRSYDVDLTCVALGRNA